jgi:HTH-type transcriptional regulator/antitoxin HigA
LPTTWSALCRRFQLRPLRSEKDLERAWELLDPLAVSERALNADQREYLETLTLLVEDYERRADPLDERTLDPIDLLKQLMVARGMTAADLGRVIGDRGTASKILNRKRGLSKRHILKIARELGIGPEALISSTPDPP